MKIRIVELERKNITTSKGPALKVSVSDGRNWYSAFDHPMFSTWKVGDEVDFEYTQNGKYKNIVTPKQSRQPTQGQRNEADHATLQRIERKIDKLLDLKGASTFTSTSSEMPYADSPFPKDDDYQGQ